MEENAEPSSRDGASSPELEVIFEGRTTTAPAPHRPSILVHRPATPTYRSSSPALTGRGSNIAALLAPFSRAGLPAPAEPNGEFRHLGKNKVTVQVINRQSSQGGVGSLVAILPVSVPPTATAPSVASQGLTQTNEIVVITSDEPLPPEQVYTLSVQESMPSVRPITSTSSPQPLAAVVTGSGPPAPTSAVQTTMTQAPQVLAQYSSMTYVSEPMGAVQSKPSLPAPAPDLAQETVPAPAVKVKKPRPSRAKPKVPKVGVSEAGVQSSPPQVQNFRSNMLLQSPPTTAIRPSTTYPNQGKVALTLDSAGFPTVLSLPQQPNISPQFSSASLSKKLPGLLQMSPADPPVTPTPAPKVKKPRASRAKAKPKPVPVPVLEASMQTSPPPIEGLVQQPAQSLCLPVPDYSGALVRPPAFDSSGSFNSSTRLVRPPIQAQPIVRPTFFGASSRVPASNFLQPARVMSQPLPQARLPGPGPGYRPLPTYVPIQPAGVSEHSRPSTIMYASSTSQEKSQPNHSFMNPLTVEHNMTTLPPSVDIHGLGFPQSVRSPPEPGKNPILYAEQFKQCLEAQNQANYRPSEAGPFSQSQGQDLYLEPSQGNAGQNQNQTMTFCKSLQEGPRSSPSPAPTIYKVLQEGPRSSPSPAPTIYRALQEGPSSTPSPTPTIYRALEEGSRSQQSPAPALDMLLEGTRMTLHNPPPEPPKAPSKPNYLPAFFDDIVYNYGTDRYADDERSRSSTPAPPRKPKPAKTPRKRSSAKKTAGPKEGQVDQLTPPGAIPDGTGGGGLTQYSLPSFGSSFQNNPSHLPSSMYAMAALAPPSPLTSTSQQDQPVPIPIPTPAPEEKPKPKRKKYPRKKKVPPVVGTPGQNAGGPVPVPNLPMLEGPAAILHNFGGTVPTPEVPPAAHQGSLLGPAAGYAAPLTQPDVLPSFDDIYMSDLLVENVGGDVPEIFLDQFDLSDLAEPEPYPPTLAAPTPAPAETPNPKPKPKRVYKPRPKKEPVPPAEGEPPKPPKKPRKPYIRKKKVPLAALDQSNPGGLLPLSVAEYPAMETARGVDQSPSLEFSRSVGERSAQLTPASSYLSGTPADTPQPKPKPKRKNTRNERPVPVEATPSPLLGQGQSIAEESVNLSSGLPVPALVQPKKPKKKYVRKKKEPPAAAGVLDQAVRLNMSDMYPQVPLTSDPAAPAPKKKPSRPRKKKEVTAVRLDLALPSMTGTGTGEVSGGELMVPYTRPSSSLADGSGTPATQSPYRFPMFPMGQGLLPVSWNMDRYTSQKPLDSSIPSLPFESYAPNPASQAPPPAKPKKPRPRKKKVVPPAAFGLPPDLTVATFFSPPDEPSFDMTITPAPSTPKRGRAKKGPPDSDLPPSKVSISTNLMDFVFNLGSPTGSPSGRRTPGPSSLMSPTPTQSPVPVSVTPIMISPRKERSKNSSLRMRERRDLSELLKGLDRLGNPIRDHEKMTDISVQSTQAEGQGQGIKRYVQGQNAQPDAQAFDIQLYAKNRAAELYAQVQAMELYTPGQDPHNATHQYVQEQDQRHATQQYVQDQDQRHATPQYVQDQDQRHVTQQYIQDQDQRHATQQYAQDQDQRHVTQQYVQDQDQRHPTQLYAQKDEGHDTEPQVRDHNTRPTAQGQSTKADVQGQSTEPEVDSQSTEPDADVQGHPAEPDVDQGHPAEPDVQGRDADPGPQDQGHDTPSDTQGPDTNVNEEVAAEPNLPLESAGDEDTAGEEYQDSIAVGKAVRRRGKPTKYNDGDYAPIRLPPPPRPRAMSQSGHGRKSASHPHCARGAFTNRGFKWVYTLDEREYLYQVGRYVILRDDFLKDKDAGKTILWRIKDGKRGSVILQEYVPFLKPDSGELFHVSNWTETTEEGREVSIGNGTKFIEEFRTLVEQYVPVYVIQCIHQPVISVVKYFNEKRALQFLMEIYESAPSLYGLFRDTLRVMIHQVTDHNFLPMLLSSGFGDTSTCLSLAKEGLTPVRNQNEAGELTTGYMMKLAQSWAEWNNIVREACRAIITAPKFQMQAFWMLFMKYPKVSYSGPLVDKGKSCWICPMNVAQNVAQFEGPLYDMATLVQSAPDQWDLSDRPVEPLQFCNSCSRIIRSFHTLYHYNFCMLTTIQERVAGLLIGFKPDGYLDSLSMVELLLSDTSWVAKMQLDFQIVLAKAKKDAARTVVQTGGAGFFGGHARHLTPPPSTSKGSKSHKAKEPKKEGQSSKVRRRTLSQH